jgi:hypothetical protein
MSDHSCNIYYDHSKNVVEDYWKICNLLPKCIKWGATLFGG